MTMSYLRLATPADYDALGVVMYEAVRSDPSPYTEAQRMAWVPEPPGGEAWHEQLAPRTIFVAEVASRIVGFMSLTFDSYLNFAFILPAYRGLGLFRKLYGAIEQQAGDQGHTRISAHASLMAQPAFEAVGFQTLNHKIVQRGGEALERFEMEKLLSRG